MPGGELPVNEWIKVAYGWGYFSVDYELSATVDCDYTCYVGVLPFAWASGTAHPGSITIVTHRVIVYGDVWLRGRSAGDWALLPVGPPSPIAASLQVKFKSVLRGQSPQ